MEESPDYVNLS